NSLCRNCADLLRDGNRGGRGVWIRALAPLIVLDAEVFDDFARRFTELRFVGDVERLGEGARIVDRDDAPQRVVVGPRVAFDEVQSLGVWRSCTVEPEPVVQSDR